MPVAYANPGTLNQNFTVANPTYTVAAPVAQPQLSVSYGGDGNLLGGAYTTPQAAGQAITPDLVYDAPSAGGSAAAGGGLTAQQIADRAAAAAENARIAGVRTSLDASANNYYTGAQTDLRNVGDTYDQNNRNFVNSILDQQTDINNNRTNNGLNLRRSIATIAAGVRNGIRSGGVSLANMNALDSGAADAMARAYAAEGNAEGNDAQNAYALADQQQLTAQTRLNRDRDNKLADFGTYRNSQIDRVGTGLNADLTTLDANGQVQGVTGGVDFSRKDMIIQDAINRLNAIDAQRAAGLGGQHQLTPEEIAAQAAQMDIAGTAGTSPFAVDQSGLALTGQTNGAAISQLPLFTRRREV